MRWMGRGSWTDGIGKKISVENCKKNSHPCINRPAKVVTIGIFVGGVAQTGMIPLPECQKCDNMSISTGAY